MLPNTPPPGEQDERPPPSGRTSSSYKGVRRRKWGRWVSEIRLPNSRERIWLGSYDTPEQAARAFDAAFVCLRGPGAAADGGLNFPGSPPAIRRRTSDAQEVYAAAVSHASKPAGAGADARDQLAASDAATANAMPPPMEGRLAATRPAPLQVSADRFDLTQLMASSLPLFSPTVVGSHSHLLPAAVDVDMEEDEIGAGCLGLWSFDSDGSCSRD